MQEEENMRLTRLCVARGGSRGTVVHVLPPEKNSVFSWSYDRCEDTSSPSNLPTEGLLGDEQGRSAAGSCSETRTTTTRRDNPKFSIVLDFSTFDAKGGGLLSAQKCWAERGPGGSQEVGRWIAGAQRCLVPGNHPERPSMIGLVPGPGTRPIMEGRP